MNEKLTRKDLWNVYLHSLWFRAVNCSDRMQSLGLTVGLIPVFEKYYPDKEERGQVMDKYMQEYFLTHPQTAFWIIGIICSLEERKNLVGDVDYNVISGIKTALMGPLASIGDGLYNGTLRPIVAGICCTLALQGNGFAPILFVLIMAAANIAIRYSGIFVGYKLGANAFEKLNESGLMGKIVDASNIVAYTVVGAFIATNVAMSLGIHWTDSSGNVVTLQSSIDAICPKLLPLLLTLGTYKLLSTKKINMTLLIFAYMIGGAILYLLGILG